MVPFSIIMVVYFSITIYSIELLHSFFVYIVPYVAILSRLLFILIFPPILFRHFQKFSKLLYPISFHLSSIQCFTIRFQPIQVVMLFNLVLRRIPMIDLNKLNHLFTSFLPTFFLLHILPACRNIVASFANVPCASSQNLPKNRSIRHQPTLLSI